MNCEHHRVQALMYKDIIKGMLKKIPKSELANILLDMNILKQDYVTNEIFMKDKCKCGQVSIGFIGLTGEKQRAICQECFDKIDSQFKPKESKT